MAEYTEHDETVIEHTERPETMYYSATGVIRQLQAAVNTLDPSTINPAISELVTTMNAGDDGRSTPATEWSSKIEDSAIEAKEEIDELEEVLGRKLPEAQQKASDKLLSAQHVVNLVSIATDYDLPSDQKERIAAIAQQIALQYPSVPTNESKS